tara:strand:- start:825 stop:1298 length:474 start_codon:yes stop_codon:yes gene_type:complete
MDLLRNSINTLKSNFNKSKKNNSLKSSVKLFNNNLNKSLKTPIKSSIKSSLKTIDTMKSNINNFDIKNIYKNNMQTNLSIFLFITIIISYISKKYFIHLGLLFILLIITYLITKNLFYALLISVIVSNLIMLLNIDFNNKDKIQKQTKETKETKETS